MKSSLTLSCAAAVLCLALQSPLGAQPLEPIAMENYREAVVPRQLVIILQPIFILYEVPLNTQGEACVVWAKDRRGDVDAWAIAKNEVDAARLLAKYSRKYHDVGAALLPPVVLATTPRDAMGDDEEEPCDDLFYFWAVDEDGDYVPLSQEVGCADDDKPA